MKNTACEKGEIFFHRQYFFVDFRKTTLLVK